MIVFGVGDETQQDEDDANKNHRKDSCGIPPDQFPEGGHDELEAI